MKAEALISRLFYHILLDTKWLNFIPYYWLAKVPVTSSSSFLQNQGKDTGPGSNSSRSVNATQVQSICQVTVRVQKGPALPFPLSYISKSAPWLEEVGLYHGIWGLKQQDSRWGFFSQVEASLHKSWVSGFADFYMQTLTNCVNKMSKQFSEKNRSKYLFRGRRWVPYSHCVFTQIFLL